MRQRTLREGSVGLLILVGVGLFVGAALWLRGFTFGQRTYNFVVQFANASKMQIGAPVRYRGVQVGRITNINPDVNAVNVAVEITSDIVIPRDVLIEANQSGFIGETSIDITPRTVLSVNGNLPSPFDPNCNQANIIICNQARVQGQIGVSFDELLRTTIQFANTFSNPDSPLYRNINAAAQNTASAASGVGQLNREILTLSRSVRQNLNNFTTATNTVTQAATTTANQISNTANQYGQTATRLNQLVTSLNGLVVDNRATLVSSLNNFSATSQELRNTVSSLRPLVNQANTTLNRVNSNELLRNLETFSANAAQASANAAVASTNLRNASAALNDPNNLLVLQRTLDSARVTFENAQKITSDLDKLTGDPAFVENLRNLVNGLNKLVSSTQQLQEQVQIAEALEPANSTINSKLKNGKLATSSWKISPNFSFNLPAQTNKEPLNTSEPFSVENEQKSQQNETKLPNLNNAVETKQ